MPTRLTLVPAYGRDYKSKKDLLTHLAGNNDFTICDISCQYDGKYANFTDLKKAGYAELNVRYKRLTMVAVFKMSDIQAECDKACQAALKEVRKVKLPLMTVGDVLEYKNRS